MHRYNDKMRSIVALFFLLVSTASFGVCAYDLEKLAEMAEGGRGWVVLADATTKIWTPDVGAHLHAVIPNTPGIDDRVPEGIVYYFDGGGGWQREMPPLAAELNNALDAHLHHLEELAEGLSEVNGLGLSVEAMFISRTDGTFLIPPASPHFDNPCSVWTR